MCFTKTKKCTIVNLTVLFCFFLAITAVLLNFAIPAQMLNVKLVNQEFILLLH